jgi:preprotein translocase subunit SecY
MLETLKNAWKLHDLRKKIIYTILVILVYRVLCFIPTPGVDHASITAALSKYSLLDFINTMTGSDLSNYSIMAMGITPYINSSIIMQLLTVAIPRLEELQKEGDEGRKKIAQYTRYVTVALGFIQAVTLSIGLNASASHTWYSYITIGVCLAARERELRIQRAANGAGDEVGLIRDARVLIGTARRNGEGIEAEEVAGVSIDAGAGEGDARETTPDSIF